MADCMGLESDSETTASLEVKIELSCESGGGKCGDDSEESSKSGDAGGGGGKEEEKNVDVEYEAKIEFARKWAARVCTLHMVTDITGLGNISFSSLVLLNFNIETETEDYFLTLASMSLQAFALNSRYLFTALSYVLGSKKSPRPSRKPQPREIVRILSQLLIVPILITTSVRRIHGFPPAPDRSDDQYQQDQNYRSSLIILIIIQLLNFIILLVSIVLQILALIFVIRSSPPNDLSVLRFYRYIVQNCLHGKLNSADFDDIDFLQFAFVGVLRPEFAKVTDRHSMLQARSHVSTYYGEMLKYMYTHSRGISCLIAYLDDDNVQEAAANLPAIWMSIDEGDTRPTSTGARLKSPELPGSVVKKLVSKLGLRQVGWAAADSIGAMVDKRPAILLEQHQCWRAKIVKELVEAIDTKPVQPEVLVQALKRLDEEMGKKLEDDLRAKYKCRELGEKLRTILNSNIQTSAAGPIDGDDPVPAPPPSPYGRAISYPPLIRRRSVTSNN